MEYNPLDPEVTRNPYPYYAFLRREAPVYRTPLGFAAVSRYADVFEILRHPEAFSSSAMGDLIGQVKAMSHEDELGDGETLLGTDPPVHTRLRKIVNRAFTPRRVAALEPRIRALCAELVDDMVADGDTDLIGALAVPLPVMVIAEILGIDPARRGDFKRWSGELVAATAGTPTPELRAALERSGAERTEYLDAVIEQRKADPRNDLISALVQAEADEDIMTENEVGNLIVLLLIAGNETTTNLIGNAVLALLSRPDLVDGVQANPALVPALVEETLRYDSPVQLMLRRATRSVEISGEKVGEGELVAVLLGSANRDERQFDEPDVFDLSRDPSRHLAFGFGTHFCLGAGLARLEARIALETFLRRAVRFELLGPVPGRAPSLLMRGVRSLSLHVTGAGADQRAAG
ncbi:MAG: cytochrome P450 [Myxococcota bacterium]